MIMSPGVRKFALTAHVTSSVGWLGAVAGFLALAVAGLASEDARLASATYPAMAVIGWWVILPLSVASLITGLVQSLGTVWGLFRHYWVLAKLILTLLATLVLLLHMRPIGYMAGVAGAGSLSPGDHRRVRIQLVFDAGAALLVLLAATVLSVYKPRGVTPYGWRKLREERQARNANP
jgi:hypothetical protein